MWMQFLGSAGPCFAPRRTPRLRSSACPATCLAVAVVAILALAVSQARAASYSWSVASGDWSLASNWGGTGPSLSDDAYVGNSGTAAISSPGAACRYLYIGDPGSANTGTIQMSGGGLSVSDNEYLGNIGAGTLIQTDGTNTIGAVNVYGPSLLVGYNSGSSGSYTLGGPGVLCASGEYVGYSGAGAFTQSGGTNILNSSGTYGDLWLGYNSGASGNYVLSGAGLLCAQFRECGLLRYWRVCPVWRHEHGRWKYLRRGALAWVSGGHHLHILPHRHGFAFGIR